MNLYDDIIDFTSLDKGEIEKKFFSLSLTMSGIYSEYKL